MKQGTICLGNSLLLGKKRIKEFERIKERVQHCLEGWQSQLLSKAIKITLIKAVTQAIPTYNMSTFRLLKQVCKEMDAKVKGFWWGMNQGSKCFLAFKKWNEVCQPKENGKVGFKLSF